jgi:hypothetical protein
MTDGVQRNGERLARARKTARLRPRLPNVGTLLLLLATSTLAGCLAESSSERGATSVMRETPPAAPAARPLLVTASVQDAGGRRERDIDAGFARRIASESTERIRKRTLEILREQGMKTGEPPAIVAESSVRVAAGRRFALVTMELDGRSRAIEIVGIDGTRMRRVFCFRDSLDAIALDEGDCSRKIAEVFKVRLGG